MNKKFGRFIDRARQRYSVQQVGDKAWMRMQQSRVDRTRRMTWEFTLAEQIHTDLCRKIIEDGKLVQDSYERSISEPNKGCIGGWILAETIYNRQRTLRRLSGLLIADRGVIFAYQAVIPRDMELRQAPDAMARILPSVPLGGTPLRGVYSSEFFGDATVFDPDACEQTVRSVSGQLGLSDLLAGLIVRHGLDIN